MIPILTLSLIGLTILYVRVRTQRLRRQLTRVRTRNAHGRYVYAFTDIGQVLPVVKIGRATDVKQRLAAHRTSAPFGLYVICVMRVPDAHRAERILHRRYAAWRIRSNGEWFWLHPLMYIDLLCLNQK